MDAMLAAGTLICCGCGGLGFPTDAIQLAADLLLVTYDGPHTATTRLIDPAHVLPVDVDRWCAASTSAGPCRAVPVRGGQRCPAHLQDASAGGA